MNKEELVYQYNEITEACNRALNAFAKADKFRRSLKEQIYKIESNEIKMLTHYIVNHTWKQIVLIDLHDIGTTLQLLFSTLGWGLDNTMHIENQPINFNRSQYERNGYSYVKMDCYRVSDFLV